MFRTVSDVLQYASNMLRHMAMEQRVIVALGNVLRDRQDLLKEAPETVRQALVDPAKQEKALSDAAQLLFDLAMEHKVLEVTEAKRR